MPDHVERLRQKMLDDLVYGALHIRPNESIENLEKFSRMAVPCIATGMDLEQVVVIVPGSRERNCLIYILAPLLADKDIRIFTPEVLNELRAAVSPRALFSGAALRTLRDIEKKRKV